MRGVRAIVLISLFVNMAALGGVLFSRAGVRSDFSQIAAQGPVAALLSFALLALLLCAPWIVVFLQAASAERAGGALAFALISVGALLFLIPASSAPAEGVGYYVLFYALITVITFIVVAVKGVR